MKGQKTSKGAVKKQKVQKKGAVKKQKVQKKSKGVVKKDKPEKKEKRGSNRTQTKTRKPQSHAGTDKRPKGGAKKRTKEEKPEVSELRLAEWEQDGTLDSKLNSRRRIRQLESAFMISEHAVEAAEELVDLMKKGKGESKRKACLDILKMSGAAGQSEASSRPKPQIDEEKARRVLLAAARRR